MLNQLLRSILEQDKAPVVVCDKASVIVYMNPSAKEKYHGDLTGKNVKDCHNAKSGELIDKVVSWFAMNKLNNTVYTYHDEKENKDVYMIALRDDDGNFIGYYEKHENRNAETMKLYDMG